MERQTILTNFKTLCREVEKMLSRFDPIVNGVIYKDFTGKEITIRYESWERQIDNAISRDYLTDDEGELEVDWDTTKDMRSVYKALMAVKHFISSNEGNESFIDSYETEYEAPLKMSNLDFWREAFNSSIYIE